jgi:hypothetical protein
MGFRNKPGLVLLFIGLVCVFVPAMLPSIREWSYEHATYASDFIATGEFVAILLGLILAFVLVIALTRLAWHGGTWLASSQPRVPPNPPPTSGKG